MPAEWEPHEGTWLQWPHDGTVLPDGSVVSGYRDEIEDIWVRIATELHRGENVHILVNGDAEKAHVEEKLSESNVDFSKIDFLSVEIDDIWMRDNGPIFVRDRQGGLLITEWNFNGWGGRYPSEADAGVPVHIGKKTGIPVLTADICIEGGGIEVDGKGSLMASKTSIINDNRNPQKSQREIEASLSKHLGITNFVWISGLRGEDNNNEVTDFHIDGSARFSERGAILYKTDPYGEAAPYLLEAFERHYGELRAARDAGGNPYKLIPVPMTRKNIKGLSYKGSYLNYYIGNEVVLVPVWGDAHDALGLSIIEGQFPGRRVAGIYVCDLYKYGGAIHCVTQQQPK